MASFVFSMLRRKKRAEKQYAHRLVALSQPMRQKVSVQQSEHKARKKKNSRCMCACFYVRV
jgi:hypothetical protein